MMPTRRVPLDLASPCLPWTGDTSPEGYGRISARREATA